MSVKIISFFIQIFLFTQILCANFLFLYPKTRISKLNNIPNEWTKLAPVGPNQKIGPMTIVLSLNNEEQLDKLLLNQQDPTSLLYHKWLKPEEFGARFGRSETEYNQIIDWLKSCNLLVLKTWPNRLQLTVEGNCEQVEQAFNIKLNFYKIANEIGYASDNSPMIPTQFTSIIQGITGLSSFNRFHPMHNQITNLAVQGTALDPAGLANVYNLKPLFDEKLDGAGIEIGIVTRSDFNIADVQKFRSQFGLLAKDPIKIFPFGPQTNKGGAEEIEAALDCEWAGAAAPAATIKAVIAPDIDFSLQSIVNNFPEIRAINISYGGCERANPESDVKFIYAMYAQAASQGQSIFVASGDDGVSDCARIDGSTEPSVNFLASSPYVTGVGGTDLDANYNSEGKAIDYLNEEAWAGSGGGDSIYNKKPDYQTGVGVPNNMQRNLPDVAFPAGRPGYNVFIRGGIVSIGGTSCGAPCWAGLCAILNQAKKANGLGNINPIIYTLGNSQASGIGSKVFHDITIGNNNRGQVEGFKAQAGYDRVTGWGSFDAATFVRNFSLTSPTDITPPTIKLLAPEGGEELTIKQLLKIVWQSSDNVNVAKHEILLSLDGGNTFNNSIATGLSGNVQEFNWTIPINIETTTQAQIGVRAIDDSFNTSTSFSKNFSITGNELPTVKVSKPNGTEIIQKNLIIKWESTDDFGIKSQDILLSTNGGTSFDTKIATGLSADIKSFKYKIPNNQLPVKTARIRVVVIDIFDKVNQDDSDGDFKILKKK